MWMVLSRVVQSSVFSEGLYKILLDKMEKKPNKNKQAPKIPSH